MLTRKAVQAVQAIRSDESRASSTCELAAKLRDAKLWGNLENPVAAARSLADPEERCKHLTNLAKCLKGEERTSLLQEAASTINELRDLEAQAVALVRCAELLPLEASAPVVVHCAERIDAFIKQNPEAGVALIKRIVFIGPSTTIVDLLTSASKKIGDHGLRAVALVTLAPLMTPRASKMAIRSAFSAVFRMAKNVGHDSKIFSTLAILAPFLDEEQIKEAISRTEKIIWNHSYTDRQQDLGRACWVAALASGLSKYPDAWKAAVAIAIDIKDYDHYFDGDTTRNRYRDHALYSLCAYAPEAHLHEAVELLLNCHPESHVYYYNYGYADALAMTMRRAHGEQRQRLINRTLESARAWRLYGTRPFDGRLSDELVRCALERASLDDDLVGVLYGLYLAADSGGQRAIMTALRSGDQNVRRDMLLRIRRNRDRVRRRYDSWQSRATKKGRAYVLKECAESLDEIAQVFAAEGVAAIADTILESARWWP